MDSSLSEEDRQVVKQAIGVLSRVAGSDSQADETSASASGGSASLNLVSADTGIPNHTSYEEQPNQQTSGTL